MSTEKTRAIFLTHGGIIPEKIDTLLETQRVEIPEVLSVADLSPKEPYTAEDLFDVAFVPALRRIFEADTENLLSLFAAIENAKSNAASWWNVQKNRPYYCRNWQNQNYSPDPKVRERERENERSKFRGLLQTDVANANDFDLDSADPNDLSKDFDSRVRIIRITSSENKATHGLLLLVKLEDASFLEIDIRKCEEQEEERPLKVCLILRDKLRATGGNKKNIQFTVGRVVQLDTDTELNGMVGSLISYSSRTCQWEVKLTDTSIHQILPIDLRLIRTEMFVAANRQLEISKETFYHSWSLYLQHVDQSDCILRKVNNVSLDSHRAFDRSKTLKQILAEESPSKDVNKVFSVEIEVDCDFTAVTPPVANFRGIEGKTPQNAYPAQKDIAKRLMGRVDYVLSQPAPPVAAYTLSIAGGRYAVAQPTGASLQVTRGVTTVFSWPAEHEPTLLVMERAATEVTWPSATHLVADNVHGIECVVDGEACTTTLTVPAGFAGRLSLWDSGKVFVEITLLDQRPGRGLDSFVDMCWIILVPPFTALRDQTLERLTGNPAKNVPGFSDLLWPAEKGDLPWNSYVMTYDNSNQTNFKKFKEYALREDKKDSLFVMVADESHWGYVKDGAHDEFVNDPELLDKDNFIVVQVSATPYINLTRDSRVPWKYIAGVKDGNIAPSNIIENPRNAKAVEIEVTLPCALLEFTRAKREVFKKAVVVVVHKHVKDMHPDKVFLSLEHVSKRNQGSKSLIVVQVKIVVATTEEIKSLVQIGLTSEHLKTELEKEGITAEGVGSAKVGSFDLEELHLEELHVVKWYPPNESCEIGENIKPSKYLRLEDFLRTIPSKLRHDSVSRDQSHAGRLCGTIKRSLSAQLIRKDKFLEPLIANVGSNNTAKKEHLWLADIVFSLLYFDLFRWKVEGGLLDIGESRKRVMKSEETFDWGTNCLPSLPSKETLTLLGDEKAPAFLKHFRDLCAELSELSGGIEGKGLKKAGEDILEEIVSEFEQEFEDIFGAEEKRKEKRKEGCVTILLFFKLLSEPTIQSTDVSRFISESDRMVLDLLKANWQEHTCKHDAKCAVWSVSGPMKIVRITGNDIGEFVTEALRVCRDKLFFSTDQNSRTIPPFAVLKDFGLASLWDSFKVEKKFQMLHLTSPGIESFHRIYDQKPRIVYQDLEGLPCILILLEKGRMGDTFPGSFNCLDLRMRTSDNCATCIQELGRVCRYPDFINTREFLKEDWSKIMQLLCVSQVSTSSHGYGGGGRPEESCNTHVDGQDAQACHPKTKNMESGDTPSQASKPAHSTSATVVTMSADKPLAVSYANDAFVGYATHKLPWGGVTGWNETDAPDDMHMSTARVVLECKVLKVEKPRIQLCLNTDTEKISLEDCRLVVTTPNRQKSHLPFYSMKSRDHDRSWVTLQQDPDLWQADLQVGDDITFLRDDSSLKYLFDEAIRLSEVSGSLSQKQPETEVCGKCYISQIKFPFPCALVLGSGMQKLINAVDKADDNFPRQIWECIKFKTLEQSKYIGQAPSVKGKDLSRFITPKRSAIHEYRTSWVAGKSNADSICDVGKYRFDTQNCLYPVHQRRLVLSAETQIGKTGAYLHFLSLLRDKIGRQTQEPPPTLLESDPETVTVACARHKWIRPYWRDLCEDEWGQSGNLYIMRGKYHLRAKIQRLAALLSVLKQHKKPWEEQAGIFLALLVGFDPDASNGQDRGECAQSLYLQACHDLLKKGVGEELKKPFYYSCGEEEIEPSEFPIHTWTNSPIEFPYNDDPNRFKIHDSKRLQILIDWDCLSIRAGKRKDCSVYASGGGNTMFHSSGTSSNISSSTDEDYKATNDQDYEDMWSMPGKDGSDLLTKIGGEDAVYQVDHEFGKLSIQQLSGWTANKKENHSNSSRKDNRDGDFRYLARRYPWTPDADGKKQTVNFLELKDTGPSLPGLPEFSCQTLYGHHKESWPKIHLPNGKSASDYFDLKDGKVQRASSFHRLGKESGLPQVKGWVFTPTYQHHLDSEKKGLLNRTDAPEPAYGTEAGVTQVLVVRSGTEFYNYFRDYGQWYIIVTLPKKMYLSRKSLQNLRESQFRLQSNNLNQKGELVVTEESGGIAYARLFVQTFAGFLGLDNVWLLDDNVHSCYELDLNQMYAALPVTHKPLLPCSFSKVMAEIEEIFASESHAVSDEYKMSQKCPSVKLGDEDIQAPRRSGADPTARTIARKEMLQGGKYDEAKTFRDYTGDKKSFGVIGIHRVPNMSYRVASPFVITHSAYSFYLLNVKETIRLGVYYAIHPPWEDIEFNQLCEEAGLAVLKCNRFFHKKINLQPQSGGGTCKQNPTQKKIKISIGGQKAPIYLEVDEGSSTCKEVWPRVYTEVKDHLRRVNKTCSTPIVFQAYGGAGRKILDLDEEKLKEELIDVFDEYEVEVIYELTGDETFSKALGNFEPFNLDHQRLLGEWLLAIGGKVFRYPSSIEKRKKIDWNLLGGFVSPRLSLEDFPETLTKEQQLVITGICDAQHRDTKQIQDTPKMFMTRLSTLGAVEETTLKANFDSLSLIFPSAMLGLSSVPCKTVGETIMKPLQELFGTWDGNWQGFLVALGEAVAEASVGWGCSLRLFSSRAPKEKQGALTLEFGESTGGQDSTDGQIQDKAFVVVRIVKSSAPKQNLCAQAKDVARPPDSIFKLKIENAGNSCYMDSILFSMFAMPFLDGHVDIFQEMLNDKQTGDEAEDKNQLRKLILEGFVQPLRNRFSESSPSTLQHVTKDSMNAIRAMCRKLKWHTNRPLDGQEDAEEFFTWCHACLGGPLNQLTVTIWHEMGRTSSDIGVEEDYALLSLPLRNSDGLIYDKNMNLKWLLEEFMSRNEITDLRRPAPDMLEGSQATQVQGEALKVLSFKNSPKILVLALKRFDEKACKISASVKFDLKLSPNGSLSSDLWTLKSFVCHKGDHANSGHYIAYVRFSEHDAASHLWLRLDDDKDPNIQTTETDIFYDDTIKTEAVLFFYEIDPQKPTDPAGAHSAAKVDGGNFTNGDGGKVCQKDARKKRDRSPTDGESTTPRQASSLKSVEFEKTLRAMELAKSRQEDGDNEKPSGGRRYNKRKRGLHASDSDLPTVTGQNADAFQYGQEEEKSPDQIRMLNKLKRDLITSNPGPAVMLNHESRRVSRKAGESSEIMTQTPTSPPSAPESLSIRQSLEQFLVDNNITSRTAWRAWAKSNAELRKSKDWPYDPHRHFSNFVFKPAPSQASSSKKTLEKSKDEREEDGEDDKLDDIDENDSGGPKGVDGSGIEGTLQGGCRKTSSEGVGSGVVVSKSKSDAGAAEEEVEDEEVGGETANSTARGEEGANIDLTMSSPDLPNDDTIVIDDSTTSSLEHEI